MPTQSHSVAGKVYFSGTNQPVEGASVVVTDTTVDEALPAVTTNAAGEYVTNLSGLTSWSAGDGLSVTATYSNRSKTETGTVSTGGGTTINLTLSITTYPTYEFSTEQPVMFVAKDVMDVDKTFTRNSTGRVTKEVHNYGKFTLTKYFKYDSKWRVINENWVIE